jgi:hypothetical protein
MIFHNEAPQAVQVIARAARNLSSSRGLRKARWRLFHRLIDENWVLKVNEAGRDAHSGAYLRPNVAQISIEEPVSAAIEFAKVNPSHRNLERLRLGHGLKILILIWNRNYKPWRDPRGDFNRISLGHLRAVDFIICAGRNYATISTPESLFDMMMAEQAFEQLDEKLRARALRARILQEVETSWRAREPVSLRSSTGERYLVTRLELEGWTRDEIKAQARELLQAHQMSHSTHNYTRTRGLKIGQAV